MSPESDKFHILTPQCPFYEDAINQKIKEETEKDFRTGERMSGNRDKLKDGDSVVEICLFKDGKEYVSDVILHKEPSLSALKEIMEVLAVGIDKKFNQLEQEKENG